MPSNIFESVAVKQLDVGTEQLQAGKTGRPAFFHANTNVKLGGWFNASKSYMDFGTAGTGEIAGLASAHNSEIRLPNKTTAGGAYTAQEFNLIFQASTVFHNDPRYPTSMATFTLAGDTGARDAWEANASSCLFWLQGFDGANGNVFSDGTAETMTGTLKIIIGGTARYLMLCTNPATA